MSKTITLTMTEEHAQTVQNACEMLMRMKLGQTTMPTEFMMGYPTILKNKAEIDHYCDMREVAERALSTFLLATGHKAGRPKDQTEQMAYEIWGTIRHALWMHDHPRGDEWSTAAHEPLSESGLDMPKCEVKDDETE